MAGEFNISEKLADNELEELKSHKLLIGKVVKEVESILLRENMTWNDWNEVIDTINLRTHVVLSTITIKEIKERYDGNNNSSRTTIDKGAEGKAS